MRTARDSGTGPRTWAFVDDLQTPQYGLQIAKAASVSSGTLYPILDRLEKAGWLVGEWENIDPKQAGRPVRRHYLLSDDGAELAVAALRQAQTRFTPRTWALPHAPFGARA